MTTNQIAYFKAKEEQEHNRITEAETQRSNMARERLERRSQDITQQHYSRSDTENVRTHLANEGLKGQELELKGTELAQNYAKLSETQRSNLANEAINRTRANADAYLSYSTAGLRQAETAKTDLDAANVISQTHLNDARVRTEYANYYNTLANINYTKARTENVLTDTAMKPIQTGASAIGNVLGGFGRVTTPTTTESFYSDTIKTTVNE